MAFHFIGGEDHDFTKLGFCTVDTATSAARRTAYARCSLKVGPDTASTDGYSSALPSPISQFWITGRFYAINSNATSDFLALNDGVTRRLVLELSGGGTSPYRIVKIDAAGTRTTLATASVNASFASLQKLDVYINYAASGQVKIYLDGTLIIDYSGDVTTNSATTLSSFILGQLNRFSLGAGGPNITYWSEIICADEDTRGMGLCTLPPAANGNAFAWTNSYASINETTVDDSSLSLSSTANQLLQTTLTTSGLSNTPAILAVCVSARAQKGATGPQNVQMNVRTGSTDYFSSTLALPSALRRVSHIFTTNPATSGAWASTDLTTAGFNIGLKSIT